MGSRFSVRICIRNNSIRFTCSEVIPLPAGGYEFIDARSTTGNLMRLHHIDWMQVAAVVSEEYSPDDGENVSAFTGKLYSRPGRLSSDAN